MTRREVLGVIISPAVVPSPSEEPDTLLMCRNENVQRLFVEVRNVFPTLVSYRLIGPQPLLNTPPPDLGGYKEIEERLVDKFPELKDNPYRKP